MGAHQKINRVARKRLPMILPTHDSFPGILEILHFEGMNGPDGIKRKSPAKDEPWHYIDPTNELDTELFTLIEHHIANLTQSLTVHNHTRAAFEAAWLSHAIVDGLTPAHHYPLGEKIEELWGHPKELRTTLKSKNIIPAANRRQQVSKNWEYWGAKGVFTTHVLFEFGVASTITPLRFKDLAPNNDQLVRVKKDGPIPLFREAVWKVYELDMYNEFQKNGWTRHLARVTRTQLAPIIIKSVMIAWYYAAIQAEKRVK